MVKRPFKSIPVPVGNTAKYGKVQGGEYLYKGAEELLVYVSLFFLLRIIQYHAMTVNNLNNEYI